MPTDFDTDEEDILSEVEDGGLDIEVIDDTPEGDKGRPRRPEGKEADVPGDDEIENYSANVQKRIKQLKFEYHEERRQKEEHQRQLDELARFSKTQIDEVNRLRKTLHQGEGTLIEQAKGRVQASLAAARQELKQAYEAGDPEKMVDAQEKISRFAAEGVNVENYRRLPEPTEVHMPQRQAPINSPSSKATEWTKENPWFMQDKEMTGMALGVHDNLLNSGVVADSDEYYDKLNATMRKRYPEKFGGADKGGQPARRPAVVVASGTRTPGTSRRVSLTKSQVDLARRLGLTTEEYAKEVLKEQS